MQEFGLIEVNISFILYFVCLNLLYGVYILHINSSFHYLHIKDRIREITYCKDLASMIRFLTIFSQGFIFVSQSK